MNAATIVLVVVCHVLWLPQLAVCAARTTAAAATAGDPTFATCNTGASRVELANLANLPLQCKPGHRPVAAAVLECFASSRVTVRNCKVVMLPGRASKAGLDCRVMHAQGFLQGPGSATLTAVLNGPKAAALLQPSTRLSVLQGLDASKLQQQLVQGLQLLFAQVVVMKPKNTTTSSSSRGGSGTTLPPPSAAQQATKTDAQQAATAPAPAGSAQGDIALSPPSDINSDSNATTSPPVPAELQPMRRHPRQRQGQHRGRQQGHGNISSTNSTGGEGQQQHPHGRRRRKRMPDAAAAAHSPAGDKDQVGGDDRDAGLPDSSKGPKAPAIASPAVGDASSAQTPNSSSSHVPMPPADAAAAAAAAAPAAPAAAPNSNTSTSADAANVGSKQKDGAQQPGHRRLQKTATSVAAAAAQNSNQRLLEAGRGHGSRALTDAGSDPASSDTSETDLVLADADLQTTAAAAGDAALGAVLSRQGSSIILQPSSSCSFQFLVTRNPTLLQADPQAAARAESAVGASRRHSSSSSWWVSLGALFAGVSAVLALVICYMSAQLWARYKTYEVLPSEPHQNDQQQQGPGHVAGSSSSTAGHAVLFQSPDLQPVRDVPEMSLELQQTRSKDTANGTAGAGSTRSTGDQA